MGDTCEICKKNPAKISIGNHSYCFDCHNKMALHDMGIDDSFTYAKNMPVIEPNGKIHTFEIEHVVLGGIVSWEANEKDGEYQFRLISQTGEDGADTAQKLFRKIVEGVCTKTLEEHKGEWSTSYFLKAQGIGRAIAKRLREVEHDDDWFPVGDIQMICRIVDPYGTDEELQRYLEGEE